MRIIDRLGHDLYISGFADEISSDFETQLQTLKEFGISYLSIRGVNGKNIKEYTYDEAKNEILPLLEKYKIKVSSIGSPIGKIKLADSMAFEHQLRELEELCKIARLFSCKYIRIFSFYPAEGCNFDEVQEEVLAKLRQFVAIAKAHKITLLHENEKDIYGDVARRCKTIFEQIPSPYLKAAYDPANFVQVKEEPLASYEMLKDHIVYLHIKDARIGDLRNVVCGRGDGHMEEVLRRALYNGYKGFLTLEPHLVVFDSLKDLELHAHYDEKLKASKLHAKEAYYMQYEALYNILKGIDEI